MTTEYLFPNDIHVTWSVMIVLYPYLSGLVAGTFVVSSLYYLFGRKSLQPVARFSLALSFVFLLFAPIPLLVHLGHPERALSIMSTPNFSSAMAGFGVIYLLFLVLVAVQLWFVIRGDLIAKARGSGLVAFVCKALVFFDLRETDATRSADRRIVKVLSGVGIPMACLLTGYVGFLFGSLKANPWWDTPLMFVIFIFSAAVSGCAMVIHHYMVVSRLRRWSVDEGSMRTLARFLWGFMIIAVSLELLEILSINYKQTEDSLVLARLVKEELFVPYVVLQFLVFAVIPFFLLAATAIFKIPTRWFYRLVWVASFMLLVQVLLMRWNVVIGGQLLSKSMRGFTSYFPDIWSHEGLLVAVSIFTVPFLILWLIHWVVPLFPKAAPATVESEGVVPLGATPAP